MQGSPKQHLVTGLFRDRDSAERAYQSSTARGYSDRDINLAMSDETRMKFVAEVSADRIKRIADITHKTARSWTDFYTPVPPTADWHLKLPQQSLKTLKTT